MENKKKKGYKKCFNPKCNKEFKVCLSCINKKFFSWKTVCCSHLCFVEYMKSIEENKK